MRKSSSGKRGTSPLMNLLIGTLIGAGIFLVVLLFVTFVTGRTKDPGGTVRLLSLPVFLLSAAVTGFVLGRRNGEGGLRLTALSALLFLLILLLIGMLLSGGHLSWQVLLYDVGYFLTALLCSLPGTKKKRRKHRI